MQLYLVEGCPFAHRASIALQEKKLPFEPVFFATGARPAALDAVGPNAKSPTLFDGNARVWDSLVVLEYLEDRYPDPALLPRQATERAEVRMLISRVSSELFSHLGAVASELIYKPAHARDEAKVEAAKRGFVQALPAWESRTAGRQFLVGDSFTLADIVLYTPLVGMQRFGVELPADGSNLRAWFDRVSARPSAKLLARA